MADERKRIRLASVGAVISEMKNCYREARRGELNWPDARSAVLILAEIRRGHETVDLEQRLERLERQAPRANGHDRQATALSRW